MIWVPPPHWFIAFGAAFLAHIVVITVIFFARGWKRGLLAIPVALFLFILSMIAGVALDIGVVQIDPLPLLIVLSLGIYGAYALMMSKRRLDGEPTHVS